MNYSFKIGVGKIDITDNRKGLQMQGMADPSQKTTGVLANIFSRAFIIEENKNGGKKTAIAIVDIWTCTKKVKDEVITRLKQKQITGYEKGHNLMIVGTHTHSALGNYTGYSFFDQESGNVDHTTFDKIVDGIVTSIETANQNLKPGKIYINKGDSVATCGKQRSLDAYENNPPAERSKYSSDTDTEMMLLKFVQMNGTTEEPVGLLNWYPIHPTDLGQTNTLISGDNKGEASKEFENHMHDDLNIDGFVAGFANSNCGDVSGCGLRLQPGTQDEPDGSKDVAHMHQHADTQFKTARHLFENATEEVTGTIEYWFNTIDMSNITIKNTTHRTWPYALGMSFAAGSSEDSIPFYRDPISYKVVPAPGFKSGLLREGIVAPLSTKEIALSTVMSIGLAAKFKTPTPISIKSNIINGHNPKPVIFISPVDESVVPFHLPIQILKIGSVAIAGIPGEPTTMAGRRLRNRIQSTLDDHQVKHVAIGGYANDYAQYITTPEEYQKQNYEGASTPFGPYTLDAYMQEFEDLVKHPDKFIDCYSDSLLDVWFYLSYKDVNGAAVKLDTGNKINTHYRFSIPWNSSDIKVYAKYKPTIGTKENTNTVFVSLNSGQGKRILFSNETLSQIGSIESKNIYCYSISLFDTKFYISYVDNSGHEVGANTGIVKSHTFNIPWDAKDIKVRAYYHPTFQNWKWSSWTDTTLTSGQTREMKFADPTVSQGTITYNS